MFLLVLHIAMESVWHNSSKKFPQECVKLSDHLMIYNDMFLTEVQKKEVC